VYIYKYCLRINFWMIIFMKILKTVGYFQTINFCISLKLKIGTVKNILSKLYQRRVRSMQFYQRMMVPKQIWCQLPLYRPPLMLRCWKALVWLLQIVLHTWCPQMMDSTENQTMLTSPEISIYQCTCVHTWFTNFPWFSKIFFHNTCQPTIS